MSTCPCWLDVMYRKRSSVCATRINLGLMISAGMLLTLSRRLIFGGLVIALGLTGKSLSTVKLELMKPTLRRGVIFRKRDLLINAQSPHKWWSTLKSAVFGVSSSFPPLVGVGGGLVCESVGKADLLSDHFDSKQSRESVDLPPTCHIHLPVLSPLLSGQVRLGVSC